MTKILYVEDNPDNVYMLTRRLKKKGFESAHVSLNKPRGRQQAAGTASPTRQGHREAVTPAPPYLRHA